MFSIKIKNLYWVDGTCEDPDDLCLHGDVSVTIGNEHFETSCTVSATALFLLKTLSENHMIHTDYQMLPCCGHFYIPNETNDNVYIPGCPHGIDWSVLHQDGKIKIVTESGAHTLLEPDKYRETVFRFVDKIQLFYTESPPRSVPKGYFERAGYVTFWNEWARRRGASLSAVFCPAVSKNNRPRPLLGVLFRRLWRARRHCGGIKALDIRNRAI